MPVSDIIKACQQVTTTIASNPSLRQYLSLPTVQTQQSTALETESENLPALPLTLLEHTLNAIKKILDAYNQTSTHTTTTKDSETNTVIEALRHQINQHRASLVNEYIKLLKIETTASEIETVANTLHRLLIMLAEQFPLEEREAQADGTLKVICSIHMTPIEEHDLIRVSSGHTFSKQLITALWQTESPQHPFLQAPFCKRDARHLCSIITTLSLVKCDQSLTLDTLTDEEIQELIPSQDDRKKLIPSRLPHLKALGELGLTAAQFSAMSYDTVANICTQTASQIATLEWLQQPTHTLIAVNPRTLNRLTTIAGTDRTNFNDLLQIPGVYLDTLLKLPDTILTLLLQHYSLTLIEAEVQAFLTFCLPTDHATLPPFAQTLIELALNATIALPKNHSHRIAIIQYELGQLLNVQPLPNQKTQQQLISFYTERWQWHARYPNGTTIPLSDNLLIQPAATAANVLKALITRRTKEEGNTWVFFGRTKQSTAALQHCNRLIAALVTFNEGMLDMDQATKEQAIIASGCCCCKDENLATLDDNTRKFLKTLDQNPAMYSPREATRNDHNERINVSM